MDGEKEVEFPLGEGMTRGDRITSHHITSQSTTAKGRATQRNANHYLFFLLPFLVLTFYLLAGWRGLILLGRDSWEKGGKRKEGKERREGGKGFWELLHLARFFLHLLSASE
jgi:hypothetical protein